MNAYGEEIHELYQFRNYTKQLCVILDTKYEQIDLNKVMGNQCHHLTEVQYNELLKLLQNFEELFDGTLET